MHFRSKFGDSSLNGWWVMVWTSSKWGKIWLSSSIWTWRSRSTIPKNNRDPNQGVLHLWSKFGDPSMNGRWVIVRTSSWLLHTHTRTHRPTDAGDDNTRRPKLASGKKWKPTTMHPIPTLNCSNVPNRKYKDYVYRKMLVQEYLKK